MFFRDKVIDPIWLLIGVEKIAAAAGYTIKGPVKHDFDIRGNSFVEAANGSEVF